MAFWGTKKPKRDETPTTRVKVYPTAVLTGRAKLTPERIENLRRKMARYKQQIELFGMHERAWSKQKAAIIQAAYRDLCSIIDSVDQLDADAARLRKEN